jgi:phosphocarrier protein FPr
VCGALASEALAVPVLIGMGVDELSVSVPLIPTIKATVRELDLADCQIIARQVLDLDEAALVRDALRQYQAATVETSPVVEL